MQEQTHFSNFVAEKTSFVLDELARQKLLACLGLLRTTSPKPCLVLFYGVLGYHRGFYCLWGFSINPDVLAGRLQGEGLARLVSALPNTEVVQHLTVSI
jgi:hypothetical protein